MADGKYGRLFTEADVIALVNAAEGERPDEALDLSVVMERAAGDGWTPRFPADEPLFLLRGQDLAAVITVWTYAAEATRLGCTPDFVTDVMKASNDMGDWQKANQHRLGKPD
jgi:hypothetical protein